MAPVRGTPVASLKRCRVRRSSRPNGGVCVLVGQQQGVQRVHVVAAIPAEHGLAERLAGVDLDVTVAGGGGGWGRGGGGGGGGGGGRGGRGGLEVAEEDGRVGPPVAVVLRPPFNRQPTRDALDLIRQNAAATRHTRGAATAQHEEAGGAGGRRGEEVGHGLEVVGRGRKRGGRGEGSGRAGGARGGRGWKREGGGGGRGRWEGWWGERTCSWLGRGGGRRAHDVDGLGQQGACDGADYASNHRTTSTRHATT